eukprot:1798040-Amphidinium_carterae.1
MPVDAFKCVRAAAKKLHEPIVLCVDELVQTKNVDSHFAEEYVSAVMNIVDDASYKVAAIWSCFSTGLMSQWVSPSGRIALALRLEWPSRVEGVIQAGLDELYGHQDAFGQNHTGDPKPLNTGR